MTFSTQFDASIQRLIGEKTVPGTEGSLRALLSQPETLLREVQSLPQYVRQTANRLREERRFAQADALDDIAAATGQYSQKGTAAGALNHLVQVLQHYHPTGPDGRPNLLRTAQPGQTAALGYQQSFAKGFAFLKLLQNSQVLGELATQALEDLEAVYHADELAHVREAQPLKAPPARSERPHSWNADNEARPRPFAQRVAAGSGAEWAR